jgi:hypothetical protein
MNAVTPRDTVQNNEEIKIVQNNVQIANSTY